MLFLLAQTAADEQATHTHIQTDTKADTLMAGRQAGKH